MHRSFDASEVNEVINHPEVFPWVKIDGLTHVDLSPLVSDRKNYLLMDQGGGFFFHWIEKGVYEVHTQFIPGQNPNILDAAVKAVRWMFEHTDANEIYTEVPQDNIRARKLTSRTGFEYVTTVKNGWMRNGRNLDVDLYLLEKHKCP